MGGVEERIGAFCDQLSRWPALADIVRSGGAGQALENLLHAWHGASLLATPGIAAWIDEIEDACARKGLIWSKVRTFDSLPAGISGSARPSGWICPQRVCPRVVLPSEAQTAPACAVSGGQPMISYTVPPS
jgi:hypothetical protein